MGNAATFIVAAVVTFGVGLFVLVLAVATWRHIKWRGRVRQRIGWYS